MARGYHRNLNLSLPLLRRPQHSPLKIQLVALRLPTAGEPTVQSRLLTLLARLVLVICCVPFPNTDGH
jgi:hypothetical protein